MTAAVAYLNYVWLCCKLHLFGAPKPGYRVMGAYVWCEDDDDDASDDSLNVYPSDEVSEVVPDFIVLDPSSMRLDALEADVRAQIPPQWTHWKAEVRVQRGTVKRRILFRDGNDVHVAADILDSPRVITAELVRPCGKASDVKARVRKYQNSLHRIRKGEDLFPFSDHEPMADDVVRINTMTKYGKVEALEIFFD
jgi:hypothetical protein